MQLRWSLAIPYIKELQPKGLTYDLPLSAPPQSYGQKQSCVLYVIMDCSNLDVCQPPPERFARNGHFQVSLCDWAVHHKQPFPFVRVSLRDRAGHPASACSLRGASAYARGCLVPWYMQLRAHACMHFMHPSFVRVSPGTGQGITTSACSLRGSSANARGCLVPRYRQLRAQACIHAFYCASVKFYWGLTQGDGPCRYIYQAYQDTKNNRLKMVRDDIEITLKLHKKVRPARCRAWTRRGHPKHCMNWSLLPPFKSGPFQPQFLCYDTLCHDPLRVLLSAMPSSCAALCHSPLPVLLSAMPSFCTALRHTPQPVLLSFCRYYRQPHLLS